MNTTSKIPAAIFQMDANQESTTKMFYDGKVIKCLVAPYHTSAYFEDNLEWANNTFVFPENTMPVSSLSSLIAMIVASPKYSEALIITTSNEIITQMVGDNVRVMTESGKIVPCPIKTLMANIHDIRYELIENELFKDVADGTNVSNFGKSHVEKLIEKLNNTTITSQAQYDSMEAAIGKIGEVVIRNSMMTMLNDKWQ